MQHNTYALYDTRLNTSLVRGPTSKVSGTLILQNRHICMS